MRLLATKLLSPNFKTRLIQYGMSLVEYPLIQIDPLPQDYLSIQSNLIFTSQNAVKLAFKSSEIREQIQSQNCFCVGEKTKLLLEENGQKVIKMHQNASDLAHFLVKNYKNESFSFFCGKRRRPEIELFFKQNQIAIETHELYDTSFTAKTFKNQFDGILFFSPSAVLSFFTKNTWPERSHGFCIGSSTAEALRTYTSNYSQAVHPNENQLFLAIHQYYTQHYAKK